MSMYNNAGRFRKSLVNSCSSTEDSVSSDDEDAASEADYDSSSESAYPPSTIVITRRQKGFGVTKKGSEEQNGTQQSRTRWIPRDLTVVKITCVHA